MREWNPVQAPGRNSGSMRGRQWKPARSKIETLRELSDHFDQPGQVFCCSVTTRMKRFETLVDHATNRVSGIETDIRKPGYLEKWLNRIFLFFTHWRNSDLTAWNFTLWIRPKSPWKQPKTQIHPGAVAIFTPNFTERPLRKNQFSTTSTKIFPVYCLIENIYISPGLLHSLVCFYSISGTV